MLRQRQAASRRAKQRGIRHPDIGKADPRVIGRHVEGPEILFDFHTRRVSRHQKTGNAGRIAVLAGYPRKEGAVRRNMHARRPHLLAVDAPAIAFTHGARFHVGGIRPMLRLGQAKGNDPLSHQHAIHKFGGLRRRAEITEHQDEGIVTHNRMFVLQIIVQAQALRSKMLANHCHPQV